MSNQGGENMQEQLQHHRALKGSVILEARNLQKRFWLDNRRIDVLSGVDLKILAGERLAIIGASGAGKSTLLHLLGTLDEPTSGLLKIGDQDTSQLNEDQLASFRNEMMGFVFQAHYLLPEFSALENVMMPAFIKRMDRSQAKAQASELLEWVGLSDRLHHRPGELSGGEKQRVALCRALMMKPRLLMADEPTGNLDQDTGSGIHKLLMDLNHRWGITLVVVTHNLNLAKRMQRCLQLENGKLIEIHSECDEEISN